MEKYPNEIIKDQREEEKKKKELQSSMIATIVFMIIAFSIVAAIYPTYKGEPARFEYVFFGVIAAFMIFLLFSRGAVMQRRDLQRVRCPNCNRYIPGDSNLCPYCGKAIFREEK